MADEENLNIRISELPETSDVSGSDDYLPLIKPSSLYTSGYKSFKVKASKFGGGGTSSADDVVYDNTTSGLSSNNVQAAIDEVVSEIPTKTSDLNNDSGYTSSTVIAEAYSATSTYAVGAYVTHDNNLYKCNTEITTAEAWNSEHWTLVDVISAIPTKTSELQNDSNFASIDDNSTANNKAWSASKIGTELSNKASSTDLANKADKSDTYTKSETNTLLNAKADIFDTSVNFESLGLNPFTDFTVTSGQVWRIDSTGGVDRVVTSSSSSWKQSLITVTQGEKYIIDTYMYGSSYYGVYLCDNTSSRTIIEKYLMVGSNTVTHYRKYITIPFGVTAMYLNVRSGYDLTIYKVKDTIRKFTVATSNLGKFEHGDGVTTPAEYLPLWRETINNLDYDLMCGCEAVEYYDENNDQTTYYALYDNGSVIDYYYADYDSLLGYLIASRIDGVSSVTTLSLHSTDGIITTNRYKVIRGYIPKLDAYIYVCHLAPSTAYDLRQLQFADLIADATGKENVMFIGDFNAQTISEYDTFITNGYRIANGGYLGTLLTLRGQIPADNIIVKGCFKINKIEMVDTSNLSTDHNMLVATISCG